VLHADLRAPVQGRSDRGDPRGNGSEAGTRPGASLTAAPASVNPGAGRRLRRKGRLVRIERTSFAVPLRSILRNLLLPAAAAAAVASAMAQAPNPIDELSRHLEGMKRQLEDPSVGVAQREILAIETAGTLDRAAQAESHIGAKQARWDEAVKLL